MSTGKIVTGILLGAAAGVIAGILSAPNKGTKPAERLQKRVPASSGQHKINIMIY